MPDRAAVEPMAVEERLTVRDALAQVPPRQRAALVLRFYEDCDVAETARVMGCSEGTVKSQPARGLARLRELLATQPGIGRLFGGMKDMPDVTTVLRAAVEEEPPLGFGASDVIARGRAVQRRRMAVRAAAGAGAAAVTAAAVIAAAVGAGAGGGAVRARTAAYVVSRVEKALAGQHLVLRGRTTTTSRTDHLLGVRSPEPVLRSSPDAAAVTPCPTGPVATAAEPSPTSPPEPRSSAGSSPASTSPTTTAEWSLLPEGPIPASACSRTGAFQNGGPADPDQRLAGLHPCDARLRGRRR